MIDTAQVIYTSAWVSTLLLNRFSSQLLQRLLYADSCVRNSECIRFEKHPSCYQLQRHALERKWEEFLSMHISCTIKNGWRQNATLVRMIISALICSTPFYTYGHARSPCKLQGKTCLRVADLNCMDQSESSPSFTTISSMKAVEFLCSQSRW